MAFDRTPERKIHISLLEQDGIPVQELKNIAEYLIQRAGKRWDVKFRPGPENVLRTKDRSKGRRRTVIALQTGMRFLKPDVFKGVPKRLFVELMNKGNSKVLNLAVTLEDDSKETVHSPKAGAARRMMIKPGDYALMDRVLDDAYNDHLKKVQPKRSD